MFLTTEILELDKEYMALSVKSKRINQFRPIKLIKTIDVNIIVVKINDVFLLFIFTYFHFLIFNIWVVLNKNNIIIDKK